MALRYVSSFAKQESRGENAKAGEYVLRLFSGEHVEPRSLPSRAEQGRVSLVLFGEKRVLRCCHCLHEDQPLVVSIFQAGSR